MLNKSILSVIIAGQMIAGICYASTTYPTNSDTKNTPYSNIYTFTPRYSAAYGYSAYINDANTGVPTCACLTPVNVPSDTNSPPSDTPAYTEAQYGCAPQSSANQNESVHDEAQSSVCKQSVGNNTATQVAVTCPDNTIPAAVYLTCGTSSDGLAVSLSSTGETTNGVSKQLIFNISNDYDDGGGSNDFSVDQIVCAPRGQVVTSGSVYTSSCHLNPFPMSYSVSNSSGNLGVSEG